MSDCYTWKGGFFSSGYAAMYQGGKTRYVYRWLYENTRGPIPEGMEIDHTCGNKSCVNLDHLEAVSHAENMQRAVMRADPSTPPFEERKPRWGVRETHCIHGHAYDEDNTYIDRRGKRRCRKCQAERMRIHRLKAQGRLPIRHEVGAA